MYIPIGSSFPLKCSFSFDSLQIYTHVNTSITRIYVIFLIKENICIIACHKQQLILLGYKTFVVFADF